MSDESNCKSSSHKDYEDVIVSSSESKCPTLKVEEKEDLRKKLEEKSKKYEHLPVYDRDEEKRNAAKLAKEGAKGVINACTISLECFGSR